MAKTMAAVSLRALIQRINRKLALDDEKLKASRGARAIQDLGDYYILDFSRNVISAKYVDPESLGREMEVLAPWESVVTD
jgi:hypothetical protein